MVFGKGGLFGFAGAWHNFSLPPIKKGGLQLGAITILTKPPRYTLVAYNKAEAACRVARTFCPPRSFKNKRADFRLVCSSILTRAAPRAHRRAGKQTLRFPWNSCLFRQMAILHGIETDPSKSIYSIAFLPVNKNHSRQNAGVA